MWILCNNYVKTFAYLKPPDSLQRPRVSRYGLRPFAVFSGIPLVFFTIVSEMSLMATPYAKNHKWTKVDRNY